MKRRNKSINNKQTTIITSIAIISLSIGAITAHIFHSSDSQREKVGEARSAKERLAIQEHKTATEKAKQAHLISMDSISKWNTEIAKTKKMRAEMKEAKNKSLEHVAALEAEKLKLIDLQKLTRIEKEVASESILRSIKAKSHAEDHALSAYATALQARQMTKTARADQEKADEALSQFANLEREIQTAKKSYAILEAQYQVILNENNRLVNQETKIQHVVAEANNLADAIQNNNYSTASQANPQYYHHLPHPTKCQPTKRRVHDTKCRPIKRNTHINTQHRPTKLDARTQTTTKCQSPKYNASKHYRRIK